MPTALQNTTFIEKGKILLYIDISDTDKSTWKLRNFEIKKLLQTNPEQQRWAVNSMDDCFEDFDK